MGLADKWWLASPSANNSNNVCNVNGNNSNLNNNNSNNYNNMVIQIGLRINRSMNYVISKLKEARVSYYIINRTTGYKEEDKFISEDKEAFKRYLPEAKKYVLIKSKAEAVKLKIDKLLDYPEEAIEKLNKIERILEE